MQALFEHALTTFAPTDRMLSTDLVCAVGLDDGLCQHAVRATVAHGAARLGHVLALSLYLRTSCFTMSAFW